jgi:starvation-inducible DNA-binding protein
MEKKIKKIGDTKGATNIGLPEKDRKISAHILTVLLANEYVLYVKTQKCHWNVESQHFNALHKLFEQQYKELAQAIDTIAERSRALGLKTIGTLEEFIAYTTLIEEPGKNLSDMGMIQSLLTDHEAIIRQLRTDLDETAALDDMGTNNFLNDLIEKQEKMAWMLRAHLIK